ncbi:MAG: hypothetical protein GY853_13955 [PVC group bacterium]|nr:hypothetical protein [PVC group bacterium]
MMITNQHGDVLLKKVEKLPINSKKIRIKNKYVVEKGEGTHTHVINDTKNLEVFVSDENIYLNVLKNLEIDHQEHGKQTIEPGIYKKEIERQFDYEKEIEKNVRD